MFEKCSCGSGLLYSKCCKPYVTGKLNAPTPEALMRSRYTAYVVHAIDYIVKTCSEKDETKINRKGIVDWSENSKWLGLEIIHSSDVGEDDITGTVEFKAFYERGRLKNTHHEIAKFTKYDTIWLYDEGKIISEPVTRSVPKVGRNDFCPCLSGKKYKHCCGR